MSSAIVIAVNIALAAFLAVGLTPVFVWWERRIAGFMQDRTGPNRCSIGPIRLGGLIQSFADMLKLIFKEDFTPSHIKYKFLFTIAPIIVFFCSFLTFATIPFADNLVIDGEKFIMSAIPNELGIMWFLAFAGLSIYGIILGGFSSNSKYGLLGSIRAAAQVISYEAAMALAIISMLLSYGSIHLTDIVNAQAGTYLGVIPMWGIFIQPIAAIIFIICAFAETNRAPFDIAEGESEIVAGYHTEYSAMRFGLFQVGEYAAMSASAAIIVTLIFGGYQIPWLDTPTVQNNMNYIMMALIIILPVMVFILTRWMKKNNKSKDINDKSRDLETKILTIAFWGISFVVVALLAIFLIVGLGENGVNIVTAVLQIGTFLVKFFMMAFVFIWIRWTVLRFRYDQLQMLGWKVLLPLALLNIVVTATFIVVQGVKMGIKVVPRYGKSFKDKLYLPAIFGGMKTTFKHFTKNLKDVNQLKTMQYPEVQPDDLNERYRGVHRLTKWEDETEKCVACYMCATACPADCIFIEAEERFDEHDEKRPKEFKIDLLECVFCGYCVEACPCDAIRMDTGIFSFTGSTREEFVLDKKALMANDRSKDLSDD